jgi:protein-tyrosine phosphatase
MGFAFVVPPVLAQGSAPLEHTPLAGHFAALVLCAEEYQPPSSSFPDVTVLHVPIDDAIPTMREIQLVRDASRNIAMRVRHGHRVLITCQQGRNRSGLVMALTLMELGMRADKAVRLIKSARKNALTNDYFVMFLQIEQILRDGRINGRSPESVRMG